MTGLSRVLNTKVVGAFLAAVLAVGVLLMLGEGKEVKTVTAHFPRAVSIYQGSDVRILGVNVGTITAVVPEGNSVRVEMEYDDSFDVPAEATAAIITPTLVSDRFVQLGPAYTEGPVLADGADIALADTGVPVELDRIYTALRDLATTLGPNGVNENGTLNNTLKAGAKALKGNGARGNDMIRNLSTAAETFGQGSGDLFETVTQLAEFTTTLAENDEIVRAFMRDLAGVSEQLAGESDELQAVLASLSDAVGTVKTFVQNNREALVTDVEKLTRVVKTINSERESLDTALATAPVAIGNLTLAFNNESGSIGSRIGLQGNIADVDGFLCAIVQQSAIPVPGKDLACEIFTQVLAASEQDGGGLPQLPLPFKQRQPSLGESVPAAIETQEQFASGINNTLEGLLGGTP